MAEHRQAYGNTPHNQYIPSHQTTGASQIESRRVADSRARWTNIVWFIYGFIAILLAMQFTLKLFAANPQNDFVAFIYAVSEVFSAPFDTMFNVTELPTTNVNSVFVPSILVAIGVYALFAWGITKLINLNRTYVR